MAGARAADLAMQDTCSTCAQLSTPTQNLSRSLTNSLAAPPQYTRIPISSPIYPPLPLARSRATALPQKSSLNTPVPMPKESLLDKACNFIEPFVHIPRTQGRKPSILLPIIYGLLATYSVSSHICSHIYFYTMYITSAPPYTLPYQGKPSVYRYNTEFEALTEDEAKTEVNLYHLSV